MSRSTSPPAENMHRLGVGSVHELFPRFSAPIMSQLLSACFQAASQMGLPMVSKLYPEALNLKPVNADALQPWLNCVWLSGCLSLDTCLCPSLATGAQLSRFLWLRSLFPSFPSCSLVSLHASVAPSLVFPLWVVGSSIPARVVWLL